MNHIEEWKTIKGFEGKYKISNYGNVIGSRGKHLKLQIHKKGYLAVSLKNKETKRTYKVHRLVGKYFISNPNCLPQINHKDGIKANNFYKNLEWATNSQNTKHSYDTGLTRKRYGKEAHAFKYGIKVFNKDREIVDILYGEKEIKSRGYQSSNINKCFSGERKTHKGMTFEKII